MFVLKEEKKEDPILFWSIFLSTLCHNVNDGIIKKSCMSIGPFPTSH